jgi:tRNA (guanosine-2'-O-)-methyltransferase
VADEIDRMIQRWGADTICATLLPFLTPERSERIEDVLRMRLCSVVAVCEDTYDPHNAVAAVRTSEALGLAEFHGISGADPFRLAPGITRGCDRWLRIHRWPSAKACAQSLADRGFKLYATSPQATTDVETVDVSHPIAVIFGNEHSGVTASAASLCDGTIKIAMYGFTESFNLSVSVALAMSRIAARRRAHIGSLGDLSAEQANLLRARWIALKVRAATEIVERLLGS